MSAGHWHPVEAELDRTRLEGRTVTVWLRDDDAVDVTPALERLRRITAEVSMPVLLAVIPVGATPDLAAWIAAHPAFTPCQHGYAHRNHAAAGARACELGGRDPALILEDLRAGRRRLQRLFGRRLSDCLVPPWNRIDPGLIPRLPALGFDRLSVFGPPGDAADLPRLNTDLDIVNWREGRVGRSAADVAGKLTGLVAAAREHGRPLGLLTHHLAHDETAWRVLEDMLICLRRHPAVAFADAGSL